MACDIGIDLGTSNTLVYMKGRGIVLNEPSVIAVSQTNSKIMAIGNEAREMLGRTPGGIVAHRPIKEGVIANFDMTVEMLKYFIKKTAKNSFSKIRAVVCIPSGVTEVEKRAVEEATIAAGAREVYLVEESMASAIGAGIEVNAPVGSMVVNLGGGTSDIAVISLGGIVTSQSLRVSGNSFDNAIIQYLKKTRNLLVGEITAEDIKIKVGSAYLLKEELTVECRGRDTVSGLPVTVEIKSNEVRDAMHECVEEILDAVKMTLEKTPPELAADVMDSGIILTGGGGMLRGFGKLLNVNTDIPVYMAEAPLECAAIGAGKILEELDSMRQVLVAGKSR